MATPISSGFQGSVDECPVCMDPLLEALITKRTEGGTFEFDTATMLANVVLGQCGHGVHRDCMGGWIANEITKGAVPSCSICRAEWKESESAPIVKIQKPSARPKKRKQPAARSAPVERDLELGPPTVVPLPRRSQPRASQTRASQSSQETSECGPLAGCILNTACCAGMICGSMAITYSESMPQRAEDLAIAASVLLAPCVILTACALPLLSCAACLVDSDG